MKSPNSASGRPTIGITSSFKLQEGNPPREQVVLNAAYADAVLQAGGLPYIIAPPPAADAAALDEVLDRCDGLLFTGGPDLDPRHYGQARHPRTEPLHPRRDQFDIALFRRADQRRLPILSICLGCQIANVARGGCLVQHVDDLPRSSAVVHYQPDHSSAYHQVEITPGSLLARLTGRTRMEVNSRHHQVVDRSQLGSELRPVAFAPDGVVEAAEAADGRFLLAVQWHPEDLVERAEHLKLFEGLVAAAQVQR